MKRMIWLLTALLIMTFTACSSNNITPTNSGSPPTSETESAQPSESPTVSDTEESRPTESVGSGDTTENPPPTVSSAPTQSQGNSTTTQPPANNSTNPPATSQPETPTPPPATDPPPETLKPTTPTKPTYTEADYKEIESIIRAYGEAKGFIWEESYTFEQGHQYYGRPNIVDLSKASVISDLKYHCDKIETQYGICYFKVVRHEYQGKLEFIVVYD